jgi:hypothetical protein
LRQVIPFPYFTGAFHDHNPVAYRPFPNGTPPYQVNTTDGGFAQRDGAVIGESDGGFVIVWNDFSKVYNTGGEAVIGQRFDSYGNKVGGEVKISQFNLSGDDSIANGSAIVRLPNGNPANANLAIVYTDLYLGDYDIYVRVVKSDLSFVRDDNIDLGDALQTKNASITSFADGSYVVSYTLDNGGGNTDILARIVSPTGTVGAPITVIDDGTLDADFSQLATLANNNWVDVYQKKVGSDHDIYFNIYTATGTTVLGGTAVPGGFSTAEETDPDIAALTGGGFVVAWTDANGDANGNQGVRATIFNNAGAAVVSDFALNTTTAGSQNEVSLVALKDGGFVATWEDDGVAHVVGQRFDATGHKIGSEFLIKDNSAAGGNLSDSHDSALLTDGRFVYAMGALDGGGDIDVATSIWDPRSRASDFNGDGHSDVLLRNASGALWINLYNGTQMVGSGPAGSPTTDWDVVATADFNGDGKSDVALRNHTSGQLWFNFYDGVNINGSGPAGSPTNDWDFAGTGDFNGDGKSDIMLRYHTGGELWVNLYDGVNIIGSGLAGSPATTWDVAGIADFDGDGKSDVLLRDHTTGQLYLNFYDGVTLKTSGSAGFPSTDWDVAGIGDFNGDARADVLLRNHTSGQLWINFYDGINIKTSGSAGFPATDWDVARVADYNGDTYSDVMLRNHNDGSLWVNLYNGANIIGSGPAGSPSTDWHFISS